VPDTVWWLNDNFAILAIEGVLNMLHGEGCQELSRRPAMSWFQKMFKKMCVS
jgi:hypothetical protein